MKNSNKTKLQCSVCHMKVNNDRISEEYLGCHYAFCSNQCKDMFIKNPHLYVGSPGHPSPKKTGKIILKKRMHKFIDNLTPVQSNSIEINLEALMGIIAISIKENYIIITYDLMQVTNKQIERTIERSGVILKYGIVETFKRKLIHYFEQTELDNLGYTQSNSGRGCH